MNIDLNPVLNRLALGAQLIIAAEKVKRRLRSGSTHKGGFSLIQEH
jgi:hypothetical protein